MLMLHQRTTTAIRDGYRGRTAADVAAELREARRARAWLERLAIDPAVRATLVEPIAVVEEALAEVERRERESSARSSGGTAAGVDAGR